VLDQNEWLAFGVDSRAVEGMAGYYFHVLGEVFLECSNFGGFAGCLTSYDGT
jgi:hypothetical protein